MKKIKSFLLFALIIGAFAACEKVDDPIVYDGEAFYRFNGTASEVAENSADPVTIDVVYSTISGGSGSVSFDITGGTEGVDYTLLNSSNSLNLGSDTDYKASIQIQPIDNDVFAATPTQLTISLSNASGGVIGFPGPDNAGTSTHTLTIIDDDCFSPSMDGTYDVMTTVNATGGAAATWDAADGTTWEGQVRLEEGADGLVAVYSIDADGTEWPDVSMGAYFAAYMTTNPAGLPQGDVAWKRTCTDLVFVGASQWGEVYSFTQISPDGATMVIGWSNDYGEAGTSILTRTDGTDWPAYQIGE